MQVFDWLRRGAIALVACALVALAPAIAMAEEAVPLNTVDTGYSFAFRSNETDGTEWREKDTSSSTYIYVDWIEGYPPRLYVDGAYNASGSGSTNCTNGGSVRATRGNTQYEIHNGVYELGYSHARITCWGDIGGGSMKGEWSPDCQGNYTDLN